MPRRGHRTANPQRGRDAGAGLAVAVEVVGALTGTTVCRLRAQRLWSVIALKDAIEERCGVHYLQQRLVLGNRELADADMVADLAEEGASAVTVGLVQVPNPRGDAREGDAARIVRCQLSRSCLGDGAEGIAGQLASVRLGDAREMVEAVWVVVSRALADPRGSKGYAEVLAALRLSYTSLPPPGADQPGQTFARFLRMLIQHYLDCISLAPAPSGEGPEGPTLAAGTRRARMSILLRLVGNLFLHDLLSAKVIGTIVHGLIGTGPEFLPEAHGIESACDLLLVTGCSLDKADPALLTQMIYRLNYLRGHVDTATCIRTFSGRTRRRISRVLRVRSSPSAKP